jgi:hypothetical protein
MDLRDDLLADTQRIFAEFADRLTLGQSRECQANIVGFLQLLIKWQSRAEDQMPSRNSAPTGNSDLTAPPHPQSKKITSLRARPLTGSHG